MYTTIRVLSLFWVVGQGCLVFVGSAYIVRRLQGSFAPFDHTPDGSIFANLVIPFAFMTLSVTTALLGHLKVVDRLVERINNRFSRLLKKG